MKFRPPCEPLKIRLKIVDLTKSINANSDETCQLCKYENDSPINQRFSNIR